MTFSHQWKRKPQCPKQLLKAGWVQWVTANADAKCIRTKEDGSKAISLGKHSVNNNEDPTKMTAEDECHNTQNGIAGLIKYYGGARQPRCDSTLMAVVGGDGRGRIGFLVDHVFFCTLHMTKMFQQRDVCSFKNIIQFRRGRRGTSRMISGRWTSRRTLRP